MRRDKLSDEGCAIHAAIPMRYGNVPGIMKDKNSTNVTRRTKSVRPRGKAWICFLLGGIGAAAAIAGFIQYHMYDLVTLRPGHPGIEGDAAIEFLTVLTVVSLFFLAYGMLLTRRANAQKKGAPE